MGCTVIDYKRKVDEISMGDKKKKDEKPTKEPKFKLNLSTIGTIVAIAVPVLGFAFWLGNMSHRLDAVEDRQERLATEVAMEIENATGLSGMIDDVNEMTTSLNKMHNYLYEDGGVKDQLGDIHRALNLVPINADSSEDILGINVSIKDNDISSVSSSNIDSDIVLGTDSNGNVYIAEDMIGEPLLLVYHEGGKEVYFYGSYNEKYHWDGECLLNVYNSEGLLEVINTSYYDDGKLEKYDIIFTNEKNDSIWYRNNRTYDENRRPGESYTYKFEYSRTKNFTNTNARVIDLMDADNLLEKVDEKVLSYYNGCTINGKCDDQTGEAYQVIYFDDGTVKTLYKGEFDNGTFNDLSGDAWDIAYAEDYNFYVYNTGNFSNGKAVIHSSDPISVEDINEIVKDYSFECELNWRQ